jgi:hypothetical protein
MGLAPSDLIENFSVKALRGLAPSGWISEVVPKTKADVSTILTHDPLLLITPDYSKGSSTWPAAAPKPVDTPVPSATVPVNLFIAMSFPVAIPTFSQYRADDRAGCIPVYATREFRASE